MSNKVLLIGPPACGKTTSAKNIAEVMGLNNIYDIGKVGKDIFKSALKDDKEGLYVTVKLPRGIRREQFNIVIEVNRGFIDVRY